MGSDGDSGVDGGPELLVLGNFMLTPRISVEQIYAWRRPLTCEQKSKDLEKEQAENKLNLQKLALLSEQLQNHQPISSSMFETWEKKKDRESSNKTSNGNPKDAELVQQEREALSALLGMGPLPQIDGEPILSSMDEVEYFVKYANRSHTHNEWVNESTLMKIAKRKLTHFRKKHSDRPINMFNEDWMKPERIISRRKSKTGPGWELLIKWTDVGMEDCTWEIEGPRILARPETVVLYIELWRRQMKAMRRNSEQARAKARELRMHFRQNLKTIENPVPWLHGCQLHPHQLESLNWCRSCWLHEKGGIFMGELGQGRTATLVAFLQCLREELKCANPFLLVVPSTQLPKWSSEIQFWSGDKIDRVLHQGPHSSKPFCLEYEIWQSKECLDGRFPARDTQKSPKADVVLMSSEMLSMEFENLLEVPWDLVVLDLRWINRLNIDRMTNLITQMHCPCFISACKLPSSEASLLSILKIVNREDSSLLEAMYSNEELKKDENRLMEQLRFYLMRNCFEIRSPEKPIPHQTYKECYIPLSFKPDQQEQYKECLIRQYDSLRDEGVHRYSPQNINVLKNIIEDLNLVCQHPLLLEEEEDWEINHLDTLVDSSGKLEALGNLLEVLQSAQINTLLLTHTQKCYALLLSYLGLKLDPGAFEAMSVMDSTAQQHTAIHNFNSKSSFLFLTTGESCGLGMELAKIRCIVIFESAAKSDDDLVALWRAFQIGNVAELPVFRFFVSGSVEERMMQTIKRSDSKGSSYDMKVLEDVLVWGTQGLFEQVHGVQQHPYLTTNTPKSAPIAMTLTYCKALVQYVFNLAGSESSVSQDLPSIRWKAKSKEDLAKELEGHDLNDTVRHINDPLLIAGYWEQLLQSDWSNRRLQEDAKDRMKREDIPRQCSDEMEFDLGSDGEPMEDVEQPSDSNKPRLTSRRKRFAQGAEACLQNLPRGQKKQRSSQKTLHGSLISLEESSNDENKWSKEALISSKAHQDVLAQIITDPNTVEGKAVQEACIRIDSVAKDLSLPINIIMMANHIVEILLTLREDRDQGSYFKDYTLLAIICFSCHLGGFHLGDEYGLKDLSAKYSQDQETMEQVFKYIAKAMWEYKQMLLKIRQVSDRKSEEQRGLVPSENKTKKQPDAAELQQPLPSKPESFNPPHSLHRDLDSYLMSLKDALKKEKGFEFEKLSEILAQPPGAPIKGHTPQQWFPQHVTSETAHLTEQARRCDAEMYHIEKSFETKWHKIEKAYLAFQERVRDHGLKALERLKYETMVSQTEVENRRQQLKQILDQTQATGPPPSTIGNLLAAFQQTQHWPHGQEAKEDSTRMLGPTGVLPNRDFHALHSVSRFNLNQSNQRSVDPVDSITGSAEQHHVLSHWRSPVRTQSTGALPLDQLLMAVGPVSLGNEKSLKSINKQPQNPTIPRVMQYGSYPQANSTSTNKTTRPFHQALRPSSHGGLPRLSQEDQTKQGLVQHNSRLQCLPMTQSAKVMSHGMVRALPQVNQSSPNQGTGSYGLISSVIPNYTNVCSLSNRPPPHPTVPGISTLAVQSTPHEESSNARSAQSIIRGPASVIDGLSFLQERNKSIQETPPVRMEATPAVKVVFSQSPNVVPITQKTTVPSTKPLPMLDAMIDNYPSKGGSLAIEDNALNPDQNPTSLVMNTTITTGVGRPPDSLSSRQHPSMDFLRHTASTQFPRLPHHEGANMTRLSNTSNSELKNPDDQIYQDLGTGNQQGVGSLARSRMDRNTNSENGQDQAVDRIQSFALWNRPSTGIPASEPFGPMSSNNSIEVSQPEVIGTSISIPGTEPSIHMSSMNSSLTAVSSVETRSEQLPERLEIQRSGLSQIIGQEKEPNTAPSNTTQDHSVPDA